MSSVTKDRDLWESYANNHAEYYVDTEFFNYPEGKREETFFKNGRDFTAESLDRVKSLLPDKKRALEIGPGVGRLTMPHARQFEEVVAIDISPTMLKKVQKNAAAAGLDNIKTFLPEENWDAEPVSYVYSYIVLQHIEDFDAIEFYINKVSGCLKTGGIAQLQFDTRKKNLLYKIRNILPAFLLPKNQQKGVRRIRRDAEDIRQLFKNNNLEIVKELEPNTSMHTFLLKKN